MTLNVSLLIGPGEAGALQYGWRPVFAITGPAYLLQHRPDAALWRWTVDVYGLGSRDGGYELEVGLVDNPPAVLCMQGVSERESWLESLEQRDYDDRRALLAHGLGHLEPVAWERERWTRPPWRMRQAVANLGPALAATR